MAGTMRIDCIHGRPNGQGCIRCGYTPRYTADVKSVEQLDAGHRVRFGPDPEDVCTHLGNSVADCWDCFADRVGIPQAPSGA